MRKVALNPLSIDTEESRSGDVSQGLGKQGDVK